MTKTPYSNFTNPVSGPLEIRYYYWGSSPDGMGSVYPGGAAGNYPFSYSATAVPEASAAFLAALPGLLLMARRRR